MTSQYCWWRHNTAGCGYHDNDNAGQASELHKAFQKGQLLFTGVSHPAPLIKSLCLSGSTLLSYYVIYFEKFRKMMQLTEKETLNINRIKQNGSCWLTQQQLSFLLRCERTPTQTGCSPDRERLLSGRDLRWMGNPLLPCQFVASMVQTQLLEVGLPMEIKWESSSFRSRFVISEIENFNFIMLPFITPHRYNFIINKHISTTNF